MTRLHLLTLRLLDAWRWLDDDGERDSLRDFLWLMAERRREPLFRQFLANVVADRTVRLILKRAADGWLWRESTARRSTSPFWHAMSALGEVQQYPGLFVPDAAERIASAPRLKPAGVQLTYGHLFRIDEGMCLRSAYCRRKYPDAPPDRPPLGFRKRLFAALRESRGAAG